MTADAAASRDPIAGVLDFLVRPTAPLALAKSAQEDGDTHAILAAVRSFMQGEVLPQSDTLETGDTDALLGLFSKARELGIPGLEVPERYGGLGLAQTTAMLVTAEVACEASFSTSFGAHSGMGTLPLALFGSSDLKARYLPDLASAERIGA